MCVNVITCGVGLVGSAAIRETVRRAAPRSRIYLVYVDSLELLIEANSDVFHVFEQANIADGGELDQLLNQRQLDADMHLMVGTCIDNYIGGLCAFIGTTDTDILSEVAGTCWKSISQSRRLHFFRDYVRANEVCSNLYGASNLVTKVSPCAPRSSCLATKNRQGYAARCSGRINKIERERDYFTRILSGEYCLKRIGHGQRKDSSSSTHKVEL